MDKIPNEILVVILSFLNPKYIIIFSVLNKNFNKICNNDFMWKTWAIQNNIRIPLDVNLRDFLLSSKITITIPECQSIFETEQKLTKEKLAGFLVLADIIVNHYDDILVSIIIDILNNHKDKYLVTNSVNKNVIDFCEKNRVPYINYEYYANNILEYRKRKIKELGYELGEYLIELSTGYDGNKIIFARTIDFINGLKLAVELLKSNIMLYITKIYKYDKDITDKFIDTC